MKVRLDKWLWAVRLYKTRPLAMEACKAGQVKVGGNPAKPAYPLKVGDRLSVQREGLCREFEVLALLDKRVGAALVKDYCLEHTDPEAIERAREERALQPRRTPGLGRPTKKERRVMEAMALKTFRCR